jgi:predicted transcriptional regulator of viral defense system
VNDMMNMLEKQRVYTTQDLRYLGINAYDCRVLIQNKRLSALKRGIYVRSDHTLDPIQLVSEAFPDAAFILQSALYILGYLNHPRGVVIAAKKSESRKKYRSKKIAMQVLYRDDKYADLGITTIEYNGKKLRISDRERTLIDCIRRQDLLTFEEYGSAVRAYILDPKKNLGTLMEYAAILRVSQKVQTILEPWMKFDAYNRSRLQTVIQ